MNAAAPDPLLRVENLRVEFGARVALSDVKFDLFEGETLGLVGESGSGKSTLARAILHLVRAAKGRVAWRGVDLSACGAAELRRLRRDLQIVFQDPLTSLNPRMTVGEAIAEPLRIFERGLDARARTARVAEMLDRVGLGAEVSGRYPHEFSGGQCQRVGIARAMILNPKLLICDEPVSSLDVSVQGQIVNLLLDLQRDAGTAMLFISHNLAVVRHLSHRILVLYSGRLVEVAPRDALFAAPVHPYTRALLAAIPALGAGQRGPRTPRAPGDQATPTDEAARTVEAAHTVEVVAAEPRASPAAEGCAFRDRCRYALEICAAATPMLEEWAPGRWAACHRAREFLT